jgi:U3 small nucleolar RNA-associated protein 3
MGEQIQRHVNYDIMKAKGIVRKRKHEDKNPRVKKRRQFEKLEKRHKTLVQNVKEGPQGLYAGEQQGIRAGLKKSTKLS